MKKKVKISTKESLFNIYNKYHNTKFHRNELICYQCNNWLAAKYYQIINGLGRNLCLHCIALVPQGVSYLVINTHRSRSYPCKYHENGCNVFADDIHKHEETCKKTNFRKCFCSIILYKESVRSHLREEHSMKTIQLEKPMATLDLGRLISSEDNTITYLPFHLSIGLTSLIVIVSYEISSNQFDVFVSNITETPRKMSYKATLIYDGIEHSKYDTVCEQFIRNSKKKPIYIPHIQDTATLNIYFENYEAIQPLLEYFDTVIKDYECPVCMETIKDSCYQCTNGHNTCDKCKSKIDACPTCRTTFNANIISIKRLTPNFWKPCKNAVNGCFIYGKAGELEDHERDCSMRKITCKMCTTYFDTNGYFVHMTKQHGMKKLDKTTTAITPGFVFYKGHVLQFRADRQIIDKKKNIIAYNWFLLLIIDSDNDIVYDEEFEMRIEYCKTITITKGKVSNNLLINSFTVNNVDLPIFTLSFLF